MQSSMDILEALVEDAPNFRVAKRGSVERKAKRESRKPFCNDVYINK